MEVLRQYIDALLDLIYPPNISCILCNGYLQGEGQYGICSACLLHISFIEDNCCPRCAKPNIIDRTDINNPIDGCSECKDMGYTFHKVMASVEYEGSIQQLVYKFKYQDATYLARNMAEIMTETLKEYEIPFDILLAVPLHSNKKKQRGYNQAHLLAIYMSKNLNIPYGKDNLIRTKDTRAMYNLSKSQRKENVEGAFQVIRGYELLGKRILLIDDIFTTGATVNACSKELMKLGAKSVTVLTFARGA